MASKKQRSGKGKGSRQGISGNPQRRAGQLAQRRPAIADEADLPPLVLDFRSGKPGDFPLRDLAYALAGGAEPRPWWGESHERILAAARALTWPSRLVDLETQACRIVGDEFYERLNSRLTGLHPPQWLRALAEETGAALRASVADGTAGRPVDLSAVVTSSLGWAHARRVAGAVTTTDGPSRSFSQPCPAARQMKNTQLRGCLGGGPGRTRRPACRCEKPAQGAAAPKAGTPGSAAVVEGHLVAVGVRERESAAERPVDGR